MYNKTSITIIFSVVLMFGQYAFSGEKISSTSFDPPHQDPELVNYLCREGKKVGLKFTTMDDIDRYIGSTDQRGGQKLLDQIIFVKYTGKIPTKENLLIEIMTPENRDALPFTGNTQESNTFFRRLRAINVLRWLTDLTPQDIAQIHKSYATAQHWESRVAAIALLCQCDSERGVKLADQYLLNRRNPIAGRVELMKKLMYTDCPRNTDAWENSLVEGLNSNDGSVRTNSTEVLHYDPSGKINADWVIKSARRHNEQIRKQIEQVAKKITEQH